MAKLSPTTKAKSNQLNADDIVTDSITIEITRVIINNSDQPVIIDYIGSCGKPFKPCKSMRRLLILAWGDEGDDYVGRRLTLYTDKTVAWGGKPVGGVRISHMSNIEKAETFSLTKAKGIKAPHTVKPLISVTLKKITTVEYDQLAKDLSLAQSMAELQKITKQLNDSNYDGESGEMIGIIFNQAKNRIRGLS